MASFTMTPLAQKAFVAPKTSTPSSASRRVVVAALSQNSATSAAKVQRRSMAALLAALPAILPVGQALALIPDDDDEELIEKARANRKAKLAEERATEKTFARTEGLNTGAVKKDLVPIQLAINALAKSGSQLASNDLSGASSTLNGSWVKDFQKSADALSFNSASKASLKSVVSELGNLQSAAAKGSAGDAKKSFVAAVSALQGWSSAAGVAGSLKGL